MPEREGDHTVEAASDREPEPGRTSTPKIQPVLVAILVAAIILLIAIGAFWTSF
jgi:hypothetical protein